MKPFLLITGMHRSGTSFLARALNLQGVYLEDLDHITSHEWIPSPDNLRGQWENKKFLDLAEKTLTLNGGSWDKPPAKIIVPDSLATQIKSEIDSLVGHPALAVGFKDPRIPIYFDAWSGYLPDNFVVIAIFRHPLKVAESLKRRDGFSYEKSLGLWKVYNQKLLEILQKHGGILLDFDWPQEKVISELKTVGQKTGLAEEIDLSDWYSKELRHSDDTYDKNYSIPDDVASIYSKLQERSKLNATADMNFKEKTPKELRRIINSLLLELKDQGSVFKKINDYNLNLMQNINDAKDPFFTILSIYYKRPDLQAIFPEVVKGQYLGLLKWAKTIAEGAKDSDADKIIKFTLDNSNDLYFRTIEILTKNEYEQTLSNLEQEVRKKESELADARIHLESVSDNLRKKESELADARIHLESVSDNLRKKESELADARSEASILRSEIAKKNLEIQLRGAYSYQFRRAAGRFLDQVFPTNTDNEKYKNVIVQSFRTIQTSGLRNYLRQAGIKLKRGEIFLAEDLADHANSVPINKWGIPESDLGDNLDYYNIKDYRDFRASLNPAKETREKQKKQAESFVFKPLISIIMPVYNPNPDFFKDAINSVLGQTYQNFELIMCDDGSTNHNEITE